VAGAVDALRSAMMRAAGRSGLTLRSSAAAAATCGDAMLVPE